MSFFKGIFFLHVPPSRVSRFPRSPRACLHSSEKCEIIIPVLQPISSPQKCRLLVLKKKNPFYSEKNQRLNLSLCFAPSSSFEIVPFFFLSQIFLVYFYAGIKKIDMDWMAGYSMTGLSREWVFDPFRLFLSDEKIDLFLVHIGGLAFDLSEGFLLAFDKTRPIGILFGAMFHGMNSQMFEIGMFPYAMMATMPLFCAYNWPKKVLSCLPNFMARILPSLDDPQTSTHCVYPVSTVSEDKQQLDREKTAEKNQTPGTKHKALVLIVLTYIGIQLFLPYSHFITKVIFSFISVIAS